MRGHVVLKIGEVKVLLDTGSPITFGTVEAFDFLGRSIELRSQGSAQAGLPRIARYLKDQLEVDVLLGLALLLAHSFDVNWQSSRVTFDHEEQGGAVVSLQMMDVPGHYPVVKGSIGGRQIRFAVDTGATVGFLPAEVWAGPQVGMHRDFVPTTGAPFETPVCRLPVRLGDVEITATWGRVSSIPEGVDGLDRIADGIIGTELLAQFRVRFDLGRGTIQLFQDLTAGR